MPSVRQSVKRLLAVRGTPHAIALGTALGLFVGLTPTVGVQMVTVVFLGTLIGANRLIAVAMVWISNPFTMVPMYYGYYYVGTLILGTNRWTFENFADRAGALVRLSWFGALKSLGWDVGVPLVVGSLVVATGLALISYPVILGLVSRYRRARFRMLVSRRASAQRDGRASRRGRVFEGTQGPESACGAGSAGSGQASAADARPHGIEP